MTMTLLSDLQSAIKFSQNQQFHTRMKHHMKKMLGLVTCICLVDPQIQGESKKKHV